MKSPVGVGKAHNWDSVPRPYIISSNEMEKNDGSRLVGFCFGGGVCFG